jgi:predicted nucleotidyltransferase
LVIEENFMLTHDAKLSELVNRLKEMAGDNLRSVILYGSAARGDFQAHRSDLNVLCVLGSLAAGELRRVAPAVQWWVNEQREPAPLFFAEEDLRRSADVFAIELLDIRDAHRVLFGKDAVAALDIPMNLHRVELEHELRTTLLKLRQHFLLAADRPRELTAVLAKSTSSLNALFRHFLIAYGETPPPNSNELLARTAAISGTDASAFHHAFEFRDTAHTGKDIVAVYGACLQALERVVSTLDELIPKREWQRAAKGQ